MTKTKTKTDLETFRDIFKRARLTFFERECRLDTPEEYFIIGSVIEFRGRLHIAKLSFGVDGNLMDVEGEVA